MNQEPKRRHSKSRKRTRRAAIMLKSAALLPCPNCGKPMLAHIACKNCGFYKGKQSFSTSKAVSAAKVQITKA